MENEKKKKKGLPSWIVTIFGVIAYILSKYLIFDGIHSFVSGTLSFVVGALIGYLILSLFNNKTK